MTDAQVAPLADLLVSYVPRIVARRLAEDPSPIDVPRLDSAAGACLLLDITGFTPLTERLAQLGSVGAEKMAGLLNDYFGALVAESFAHGGEVVEFEGDAMLVVWWAGEPGIADAAHRAIGCGLALQQVVERQRVSHDVHLSLKITAAAGDLNVMHVGGVDGRKRCLVAGPPIVELGQLEGRGGGGLVVAPGLARLLEGRFDGDQAPDGTAWVRELSTPPKPRPLDPVSVPSEALAALREYVPAALEARLGAGGDGWLAEFRRVTSVFVNLLGVTYADAGEVERLDTVTRAIQRIVYRYGGTIEKLVESAKGTVVFAAFGLPPRAHEDDPVRGVRAAIEIEEAVAGESLRSAIGISTGSVFCGPIGGPERRDFTVVGDAVNLAARLMQAAADDILCDSATELAFDRIEYDRLPSLRLKGKEGPVEVFRPHGDMPKMVRRRAERVPIVGRETERSRLADALDRVETGRRGVVIVEGEAGIGKSRLVEDLIAQAEARGLRVVSGSASGVEVSTPYFAWRPILWDALELSRTADNPGARRRHVLRWLRGHSQPLDEASLLNSVLGVRLPDDPSVSAYSPEARAERTRALLAGVLAAAAGQDPLVITIDDVHWLDSASWGLALQVSRDLPGALLVMAARPLGEATAHRREVLEGATRVVVDRLSSKETLQLICRSLEVDSLPNEVSELIVRRAEGHPFFSEELAFSLRDSGVIVVEDGTGRLVAPDDALERLTVPDTVQGVITSRVDHLEARQQLLLKVASVLGPAFDLDLVRDVLPVETDRERIAGDLRELQERGLLNAAEPASRSSYTFRHAITREVVYGSMLYAQRRQIHRAAASVLENRREDPDPLDELLAHHWLRAAGEGSDDIEALRKAELHLTRAGAAAVRQGAFVEAEAFLSQALSCHGRLPESDRSHQRELEILKPLGTATFATHGFGSADASRIYERTFELARGRVTGSDLFPILWGLWITTHFSSAAERAIELGEQLMEIAEEEDNDEFRMQAHHALWTTLIQIPDYGRARGHLAAGVRLYRPEWHERHCAEFGGHDPGSCAQRATALTAWTTGSVDEAVLAGREAVRLAQDHDYSKLNAMLALAFVHRQRGDLEAVARETDAIVALARDRRLLGLVDWATILSAWARGRRGQLDDAIAVIERSSDRLGMKDPGYLAMLAELYLLDGRFADGLRLVGELLEVVERKNERSYEPELHRLCGELLLRDKAGDAAADEKAERCFRRALGLAGEQGALSFSLRASLSIARLLSGTERSAEGVALLSATYGRFSEGFSTQDLVDSREFLKPYG